MKLTIPGIPTPKLRPRFTNAGGYPRAYEAPKTAIYENLVALCYQEQGNGFKVSERCSVKMEFLFPLNKGDYNSKREPNKKGLSKLSGFYKPTKPDLDNLVKSVLDGLNKSGIWLDDACVCSIEARKGWSQDSMAIIEIEEI